MPTCNSSRGKITWVSCYWMYCQIWGQCMQTNHWIFHISVTYNNHLMIRIVDFLVDFALLEPLGLWDPGPMSEQPPLGGCHSFLEGISTVDAMENPALLDSCIEVPLKHLRFVLIWNPSSSSSLSPHTFYYGACVWGSHGPYAAATCRARAHVGPGWSSTSGRHGHPYANPWMVDMIMVHMSSYLICLQVCIHVLAMACHGTWFIRTDLVKITLETH